MAVEHAAELASIVASYLRKHGFSKTLAAFLRENCLVIEDTEVVDIESLYKLYVSTQASDDGKKATNVKPGDGPKDFEGANNGGEKNATRLSDGQIDGGSVEKKKKRKKEFKENHDDASKNGIEMEGNVEDGKAETKAKKEKQDVKKKRSKERTDEDDGIGGTTKISSSKNGIELDVNVEDGKAEMKAKNEKQDVRKKRSKERTDEDDGIGGTTKISAEGAIANGQEGSGPEEDAQAGRAAKTEAPSEKASKKERKKQQKGQADIESTESLPTEAGLPKKKKDKKKHGEDAVKADETAGKETGLQSADVAVGIEEANGGPKKKKGKKGLSSKDTEEAIGNLQEPCNVNLAKESNVVEVSASEVLESKKQIGKKRKAREAPMANETAFEGIPSKDTKEANGRLPSDPSDLRPKESKGTQALVLEGAHDLATGSKKQSGKKIRKGKEGCALEEKNNGKQNQTEEIKVSEEGENAGDDNEFVGMNETELAKSKKKKENLDKDKLPTAAYAFKRVVVEKVAFSDPRLGDNSYWAKDGAEEGYGAKAQEVLGLVRGRDFRHEKTKKKRGTYRGGLIGMESHSIKFENSDED